MSLHQPGRDPFRSIWRASLMLFGSVVVLNLAVYYVRPLLPWLAGAGVLLVVTWVAVVLVRWWRSR